MSGENSITAGTSFTRQLSIFGVTMELVKKILDGDVRLHEDKA